MIQVALGFGNVDFLILRCERLGFLIDHKIVRLVQVVQNQVRQVLDVVVFAAADVVHLTRFEVVQDVRHGSHSVRHISRRAVVIQIDLVWLIVQGGIRKPAGNASIR